MFDLDRPRISYLTRLGAVSASKTTRGSVLFGSDRNWPHSHRGRPERLVILCWPNAARGNSDFVAADAFHGCSMRGRNVSVGPPRAKAAQKTGVFVICTTGLNQDLPKRLVANRGACKVANDSASRGTPKGVNGDVLARRIICGAKSRKIARFCPCARSKLGAVEFGLLSSLARGLRLPGFWVASHHRLEVWTK